MPGARPLSMGHPEDSQPSKPPSATIIFLGMDRNKSRNFSSLFEGVACLLVAGVAGVAGEPLNNFQDCGFTIHLGDGMAALVEEQPRLLRQAENNMVCVP